MVGLARLYNLKCPQVNNIIFIFQRQNAVVSCTLLCGFHSVMHVTLVFRAPLWMDARQVRASYLTVDIPAFLFDILSSEIITPTVSSFFLVPLPAFSGVFIFHYVEESFSLCLGNNFLCECV